MPYILLVEDNLQSAEMVIHILTAAGYEIKHFARGLEGAKQARKEVPSLILMDFNLPDIDGRNLVLALKKQLGGNAAPPIVAVTARTGDQEMYIARHFGCDAFISKPFAPDHLLDVVKQCLASVRK
jgi:two-component system, OmpR family, response regulator BaeR